MAMPENKPEAAERYTSYHSDDTYSLFDEVRGRIKRKWNFHFEYNGIPYSAEYNPADNKWTLHSHEPKFAYLMPWRESNAGTVAEFSNDAADEFISTFEIEGKTVGWILDNQRWWKYRFSAKHLEEVLTGFSFWFVYRKTPCGIFHKGNPGEPGFGRYISIAMDQQFDPTHYAPSRAGEKLWSDAFFERNLWNNRSWLGTDDIRHVERIVPSDHVRYLDIGPFNTIGELLDTVQLNNRTLREIFDTEYDDGAVLCGQFDG